MSLKTSIRLAAFALVAAGSFASPAGAQQSGAQELGRLFLTPEQRSTLDARRKARVPDKPAAVLLESPYTRVDGSVRRSAGKSTVWVNGEAIPEGVQPEGARLSSRGAGKDRVSVPVGESKQRVELRPGETLDRFSGQVQDVIGGGEIKIKPGEAKGDAKPR
jgi:hypothetical protein